MTNKEFVLNTMKKYGKMVAESLQEKASEMTGTELYEEDAFIPDFDATRQYLNYPVGYVCKSASGRLVKLLQTYDSTVYTGQPEDLPAQWGFYWSTNPSKALPFVSIATSPYMFDDCCTWEGNVYQSVMDNNTWSPTDYPDGWKVVEE